MVPVTDTPTSSPHPAHELVQALYRMLDMQAELHEHQRRADVAEQQRDTFKQRVAELNEKLTTLKATLAAEHPIPLGGSGPSCAPAVGSQSRDHYCQWCGIPGSSAPRTVPCHACKGLHAQAATFCPHCGVEVEREASPATAATDGQRKAKGAAATDKDTPTTPAPSIRKGNLDPAWEKMQVLHLVVPPRQHDWLIAQAAVQGLSILQIASAVVCDGHETRLPFVDVLMVRGTGVPIHCEVPTPVHKALKASPQSISAQVRSYLHHAIEAHEDTKETP